MFHDLTRGRKAILKNSTRFCLIFFPLHELKNFEKMAWVKAFILRKLVNYLPKAIIQEGIEIEVSIAYKPDGDSMVVYALC